MTILVSVIKNSYQIESKENYIRVLFIICFAIPDSIDKPHANTLLIRLSQAYFNLNS